MTLRLNGSTSGYTEIDAPAVAGSNTLVLPTGNGSADQALVTNGSGTLSFADRGRMTLATAQNSTSGTSIDFTGIPSWVKRVTVMFNGVSTNGSSIVLVQLGTSSGFATLNYLGAIQTGTTRSNFSSGFPTTDNASGISSYVRQGIVALSTLGSNIWAASINIGLSSQSDAWIGAGSVTLSGTLDRVRITTVNGTDTFDAGSINLLLEG